MLRYLHQCLLLNYSIQKDWLYTHPWCRFFLHFLLFYLQQWSWIQESSNTSCSIFTATSMVSLITSESAHVIEFKGGIVSENCTTKHCSVIFEITLLQRECSHPLFVAELDLKVVFPGRLSWVWQHMWRLLHLHSLQHTSQSGWIHTVLGCCYLTRFVLRWSTSPLLALNVFTPPNLSVLLAVAYNPPPPPAVLAWMCCFQQRTPSCVDPSTILNVATFLSTTLCLSMLNALLSE